MEQKIDKSKYTLKEFRELTKNMPDSTLITTYDADHGEDMGTPRSIRHFGNSLIICAYPGMYCPMNEKDRDKMDKWLEAEYKKKQKLEKSKKKT